ncbi:epimerase [Agromyces seonyuensis]|uniref:DUF1731 domain-containing protein n=1 Tax=Agromyces seonyuensis TaxID=2662446 RepID=A0A6I4P6R2_9MICO|nr:DUF1731 domain-containing protein [Agromyces seonyuensis]MWC00330.1 DUF1731 domain-containing protein [Agromyces seonyuensis]
MTTGMTAVVAGASGFVGTALIAALEADGYEVRRIGRTGAVTWDDPASIRRAVEGADLVVNLAGKSVNCRYTEANRDEILRSRVATTRSLSEAIGGVANPPRVWMNASTATIYRHETERPNREQGGILGSGFSVDVARAWEREFFAGDLPGTRRVALRMAIVLGDGPATNTLFRLARIGLGGPQYDGWWFPHRRYRGIGVEPTGEARASGHPTHGHQRFSWIHLDDAIGAIRFLRDRDDLAGPVNLASPNPVDNASLMRSLRSAVGAPIGLPARRWMLEPAMLVLRTEPELVLKSRWVVPGVLADAGYRFEFDDLDDALADLSGRSARMPG